MGHQLTRQELFDLAWAEPMQRLAKRFGISDVGLAKICKAAYIPLPPRGYWATVEAGQSPLKAVLPIRFPGHGDVVRIGQDQRAWNAPRERPVVLPMPQFDEGVDALKVRVAKLIGVFPKRINLDGPHPLVARCLEEDEQRRRAAEKDKWTWKKPLFDEPKARRRLTIVNALFNVLARAGCHPQRFPFEADEYHVKVGDQHMKFTIRDGERRKPYTGYDTAPLLSERLVLEIQRLSPSLGLQSTWNEVEVGNLSKHVVAIANTLMMAAELEFREWKVRCHEASIKQLAQYEEDLRLQKLEEERQAALRLERERKHRIETLLLQATNMQKADSIRSLVAEVLAGKSGVEEATDGTQLAEWASWASGIADDLDPRLLSPDALMETLAVAEP